MTMHVYDLPANQTEFTVPDTIQGKYILVDKANGQFQLKIGPYLVVTADRNTRIELPESKTQDLTLRLLNMSGVDNHIEIEASSFPIVKKVSTEISETVNIADNQQIGIDPQRNTVQVGNAINASLSGNVNITPGQINQLTTAIGQAMTMAANQLIGIDPNSNEVAVVPEAFEYRPLPDAVIGASGVSGVESVAANPDRIKLLVNCPNGNTGNSVHAGTGGEGIWIKKNQRALEIEGSNEIEFRGTDGNEIHLAEIVRVA